MRQNNSNTCNSAPTGLAATAMVSETFVQRASGYAELFATGAQEAMIWSATARRM